MLRNKDILELKRRFKKEACTITKMCGCYVDANKNKVVELNETFLNLEDEEFYKYLDIAKRHSPVRLATTCWSCTLPKRKKNREANSSIFLDCAKADCAILNFWNTSMT